MTDYLIMDDGQRKKALDASADILEVAQEHSPMAVFEGMCTLIAYLSNSLNLPLSSAINRISDRYRFIQEGERQGSTELN